MLKAPKTEKSSHAADAGRFRFGASAMQGWRWYMEDATTLLPNLDAASRTSFIGIYDGHVTPKAAQFCATNLHKLLLPRLQNNDASDLPSVLHSAFLQVNQDYYASIATPDDPDSLIRAGGTTATVVLLSDHGKYHGKLLATVANVGDCRCVLSRGGVAVELTRDHRPDLEDEKQRIEAVGGKVSEYGRLENDLNLSRTIGDFRLKTKGLTTEPEVKQVELDPVAAGDEFMVVASDGIWECRSSQEVVDFVRQKLEASSDGGDKNMLLPKICEELMDSCMKKERCKEAPGTADNISIVIVLFVKQ